MNEEAIPNWRYFRDRMLGFASLPLADQRHWWFRGHSSSAYDLVATIDRDRSYPDDRVRERKIRDLLLEFRREAMVVTGSASLPDGDELELLARHHGLPSPLLDWSLSPWIASFFAFLTAKPTLNSSVVVYAFNRSALDPIVLTPSIAKNNPQIELIDDATKLRFNRRALQQRGVFMRVSTAVKPVGELLGRSLSRFVLPASDRDFALADLDHMLLNPTNLLYDLEGAARTAVFRVK